MLPIIQPGGYVPVGVAVFGVMKNVPDNPVIDFPSGAQPLGKGGQILLDALNGPDVFFDFLHPASGEFPSFVYRTKQALVPGTVSSNPDQKAFGLIGGTNRALFKIQSV
jgi:hypothetical protein